MVDRGRTTIVLRSEVDGSIADFTAVDALARLALVARRHGAELQVTNPSLRLLELLHLAGLDEVIRTVS